MKTIIRKSVWETNSSSSHSISFAGEDKEFVLDTIYPDENGVITLTGGEFGWDYFKHNDALTKANYVAQQTHRDRKLISEVIKEQTGALEVIFETDRGYIDHDSECVGGDMDKEKMRNFIFNKNSWLFGGNDNEHETPDFTIVPEYKDGKIIEPPFTYELSIIGINRTVKFLQKPSEEDIHNSIDPLVRNLLLTNGGQFIIKTWMGQNSDDHYEFNSHSIKQNYKNKKIIFVCENKARQLERYLEKNDSEYQKLSWYEKQKYHQNEFFKYSGVVKIIKFSIKKIKKK